MPPPLEVGTNRKLQRPPLEFLVHMPSLPGPLRELRFSAPLSDTELENFCRNNEAVRIGRAPDRDYACRHAHKRRQCLSLRTTFELVGGTSRRLHF